MGKELRGIAAFPRMPTLCPVEWCATLRRRPRSAALNPPHDSYGGALVDQNFHPRCAIRLSRASSSAAIAASRVTLGYCSMLQKLAQTLATFQIIRQRLERNPRPTEHRLAAEHSRAFHDHACHGIPPHLLAMVAHPRRNAEQITRE